MHDMPYRINLLLFSVFRISLFPYIKRIIYISQHYFKLFFCQSEILSYAMITIRRVKYGTFQLQCGIAMPSNILHSKI